MLSCQHFVTNLLRFAVSTEGTVRNHWPGFWTLEEVIYCYCWWCWKVSQLVEQVEWSAVYGSQRSFVITIIAVSQQSLLPSVFADQPAQSNEI